jgi:hypothetical protein
MTTKRTAKGIAINLSVLFLFLNSGDVFSIEIPLIPQTKLLHANNIGYAIAQAISPVKSITIKATIDHISFWLKIVLKSASLKLPAQRLLMPVL